MYIIRYITIWKTSVPCVACVPAASLQIAREHQRQFDSAQLRGVASPLPSRTPIADIVDRYVTHMRTIKTAKSSQTDTYYLREAFGSVCDALKITSRRVTEKNRKRALQPDARQDLRVRPVVIEASDFESITSAQISAFISGHMVGEMTDMIVQAFAQAEARADSLKGQPLLLLIVEADALAAKRVDQHMHHEDKAGLNTLLQRIDGLRLNGRRIVVLFITNRPDALDPAIRRRAALQLTFRRPNDEQRAELFRQSVPEVELNAKSIRELVTATGTAAEKKYGAPFTWSDITDRLVATTGVWRLA